jgi:hypothetical protein
MLESKQETAIAPSSLGTDADQELRRLHERIYTALSTRIEGLEDVQVSSTRHLAADLADIYVGAERYQRLINLILGRR